MDADGKKDKKGAKQPKTPKAPKVPKAPKIYDKLGVFPPSDPYYHYPRSDEMYRWPWRMEQFLEYLFCFICGMMMVSD